MDQEFKLVDFIKYYDATSHASLKALQTFILSLNRSSLQHLIQCYLIQSMLANNKLDKKSINQTYSQWILSKNQIIAPKVGHINGKLTSHTTSPVSFVTIRDAD